ncbi:MAG: putative lipid II flippase FtsW [Candidatus Dadabacteria bacterium]|nr:putative lipid II flippase FtsW [Candidatus Dadabacteria bacterium]
MFDFKNRDFDILLLGLVLIMAGIGVAAVYNSSSIYSLETYNNSMRFLKFHVIYLLVGITLMITLMHLKPSFVRKLVYPGYLLGLAMLVAVLLPEIGKEVGGGRRWISIHGFSFQPSEFCKYMLVIYIAHFLFRKEESMRNFWVGVFSPLLVGGAYVGLILVEPDLGTSFLVLAVLLIMLFVGGARVVHLLGVGAVAIAALAVAIVNEGYRMERITSFLDPWKDPFGSGYQAIQSFMAFGLGGIYGSGLGNSSQKLLFLPQAHTDFIFSIIGEEFGFIGVMTLIVLFLMILARCVRISMRAENCFSRNMVFGFTALITLQAALNMGVAVGLFPTTGLPMPLVSYGGSSLVATLAAFGIILSVSRFSVRER